MINRKINPKHLFFIIMGIALIISLIFGVMSVGENLKGVMSFAKYDTFMDFFNCINHSATLDPYITNERIYPAFAYMFYYFIGLFIPEAVDKKSSLEIRQSQNGLLIFAVYMVITTVVLIVLIKKMYDSKKNNDVLVFILFLMTSAPFLFLFERANIIIVSLIFSMLFFVFKDSENKILREFSLLFLAIAACIKIYPAVFGLVLLKEKRYKESLRCALYGILLFVLPFSHMGGYDKIGVMLDSLMQGATDTIKMGYGYKVNISNTIAILCAFFKNAYGEAIIAFGTKLSYLIFIVSLVAAWFSKSKWRTAAILAALMAVIPGFSYMYSLIFMLVPLIFFFNEDNHRRIDYVYAVLFAGIFGCFAFGNIKSLELIQGDLSVYLVTFIQSIAIFIMVIMLDIEGIKDGVCRFVLKRDTLFVEKEKKNENKKPALDFGNLKPVLFIKKLGITKAFIVLMGLVLLASMAFAVLKKGHVFNALLFNDTKNTFMEFFDSIYQSGTLMPYVYGGTNPPLYYVIFAVIKAVIPFDTVAAGGEVLKFNQISLILFVVLFSILIAGIFFFMMKNLKQKEPIKICVSVLLLLSAPMLYAYERGSMILAVLILVLAFLQCKDSKKWWVREIGVLCLAVTNGLYIYMIFFIIYFIREKKYKELIRYIIYSIVLWVGPFMVLKGGLANIELMYNNVYNSIHSAMAYGFAFRASIPNLVGMLFSFGDETSIGIDMFGVIIAEIVFFLVLISIWGLKENWKKMLAVSLLVVATPQISYQTALILLIPAVILFINEADENIPANWVYLIGFVALFMTLIFGAGKFGMYAGLEAMGLACFIENIALALITIMLIVDGFRGIIKNKTEFLIVDKK